ncbi:MAG TPA: YciI family protein [Pirellulales bacterium]|nr:YciI family protein [Pirellulales bacterium]
MKYMLLVYMDEQAMNDAEKQQCYTNSVRLTHELNDNGQYVAAAPLHPVAAATSVRVREGKSIVTDGPFAETREQLGGFYIVDVKDLDEAIAVAARIPPASKGVIEIRPIRELDDLPAAQFETAARNA